MVKMYYFNPNGYGDEYFILAGSKGDALIYLIKHIEDMIIKEPVYEKSFKSDLDFWKSVDVLDEKTLGNYTIDEHGVGSVIHSEIS